MSVLYIHHVRGAMLSFSFILGLASPLFHVRGFFSPSVVQVLIYSGQLDVIVAAPLTERFLPSVNWTGAAEYKTALRFPWKVQPSDTEVAGYVRQVQEFYQVRIYSYVLTWFKKPSSTTCFKTLILSQVVIRGGGHILPYDQPVRSFDMIDRFLSTRGWI